MKFTKLKQIATLSIYCVVVSHCKSLYDLNHYIKEPARGEISDDDWEYAYGYTDAEAKRPDGIAYIIVLTHEKPTFSCPRDSDKKSGLREVIVGIDGKIGEMRIGGSTGSYETEDSMFTYKKQFRSGNAAFFDPNQKGTAQYSFAKTGKIKITKISKDVIEGSIVAKHDEDHYVNGRFKAKICKWGQLH